MEHDRFREWLHLSVFNELDGDEQTQLETHVQSCGECQRERQELVRMLEAITESDTGEPSEEALVNARQSLSAALEKERAIGSVLRDPLPREPFLARWFGTGRKGPERQGWGGWFRGYRVALAGVATLCLGFFVGYLAFGRVQPVSPIPQVTPAINEAITDVSNVHFLDADAADGEVELLYDVVRPVRLKAGTDDRRMRKLLAHAILNGGNPGVRLEAINVFETGEGTTPQDDVKQALLGALISDPNAGVRRRALLVLQRLPFDDDIKAALIFVLARDENPGLRVAAMNYLAAFAVDGEIPEKEYNDILDAERLVD
jgi:hypothetical protein